jgi:uncharacterized membrane protein YagU involved in acid resistance
MEQRIQINSKPKPDSIQTIIFAGVAAGLLDGVEASVMLNIKLGLNPGQVMQYVASGLFGQAAFKGGVPMILIGILLHFGIAITTTVIYFFIYPKIKILRYSPIMSGLLLGLCAWIVMNLIVVPLSKTPPTQFGADDIMIGIIWHMILVGLPISFIIKRYFDK